MCHVQCAVAATACVCSTLSAFRALLLHPQHTLSNCTNHVFLDVGMPSCPMLYMLWYWIDCCEQHQKLQLLQAMLTICGCLQLNSRVSDQELVGSFRQFGNVIDYTVIRATSCAYIDYDESHAATLARRAMNGALLGGSALRVEFKVS